VLLKWIHHPKMKILSSFTHPQIVTNMYEFLFFLLEVNGAKNCLVPIVLQNIFLYPQNRVNQENKTFKQ